MASIPFFARPRSTRWVAGQVFCIWAAGDMSANVEDLDFDLLTNPHHPSKFVG
jgi:hypothetical protein